MKLFSSKGISAKGKILPYEKFRLFYDIKTPAIDSEKKKVLCKLADTMAQTELPIVLATDYMNFERTGERRDTESKMNIRRNVLFSLSCAKAAGCEVSTDAAIDAAWAMMEESNWSWPAHNNMNQCDGGKRSPLPLAYGGVTPHHIDLSAAFSGSVLAYALYVFGSDFKAVAPVICERMEWELNYRIFKPFMEYDFWWSGFAGNRVNNWNPWCISNILFAASITIKDSEMRQALVERAMAMLDNYSDALPADGGCDEGPSYWGKAGASYFDCLEILYDMSGGAIDVFDDEFVRSIGEFMVKVHISDYYFVNFSDAPPQTKYSDNLLERYGRRCHSNSLISFGRLMQSIGEFTRPDPWSTYRSLKNLCYADTHDSASLKAQKQSYLPLTGVMTVRETDDFHRGLFLAAKSGHNEESHNHNDIGNFIVYCDGNPLIVDTGADTYTKATFDNRRYTLWYMNSDYHNLPTIRGIRQCSGRQYTGKVISYDGTAMTSELKNAYPEQAKIKSYTRTCGLLNGEITIKDKLSLEDSAEVVFHIITPCDVTVSDGAVLFEGGHTLSFNPSLEVTVEHIPLGEGLLHSNWERQTMQRICFKASDVTEAEYVMTIK